MEVGIGPAAAGAAAGAAAAGAAGVSAFAGAAAGAPPTADRENITILIVMIQLM